MARRKDCADCPLAENCVFPRIFKPLAAEGKNKSAPFCIEPELDEKRAYETGENFCFSLKLFSHACEYLPFFVMAFRMAGEKGIGSDQMPGTFHLDKILANGISIYDPIKDKLQIPEALPLPDPGQIPQESSPLTLNLHILTPLRHKSQNHFASRLNFPELFHLILRRIKSLYYIDGTIWNMTKQQYQFLRTLTENIDITEENLFWHDWTRYSSRQDTYMKLGGLMGSIRYSGNLAPFKNLLEIAQITHIGKQTSFGLGWLQFKYL